MNNQNNMTKSRLKELQVIIQKFFEGSFFILAVGVIAFILLLVVLWFM